MIEGLIITFAFTAGFWLAYLKGKEAGREMSPSTSPVYKTPPMPPVRTPPPAPPPAHIAEHKRSCPIYQEWERSVSCGYCGNRLSEKPEPPQSSVRKEGEKRP